MVCFSGCFVRGVLLKTFLCWVCMVGILGFMVFFGNCVFC